MRSPKKIRLAALVALLLVALPAQAQPADPWVGKRVITKFGTMLRVGGQIADNEKREGSASGGERRIFRMYRVEETNGPLLRLVAEKEGVSGWVKVSDVVPFDQAIDYFTNEIRANPKNDLAFLNRGQIWQEKGDYAAAIGDYNEAIRLAPQNEMAHTNRGNAWRAKKEFDKAITDYTEAIRIDPNYALAYTGRGIAWRAKRGYDKAIADYSEAIRIDPKDSLGYKNRARIWATCPDPKFRDGKKAVESATRACVLSGWRDANMLDGLAAAYAELEDLESAVKWQEKALALTKDEGFQARLDLYKARKLYRDEPKAP